MFLNLAEEQHDQHTLMRLYFAGADCKQTYDSMLLSVNAANRLSSLFCGFTVMGGEKVYPELGDNPWEHPKTIYLEVSAPDVSLEDLNPDWTEDEYYLVD